MYCMQYKQKKKLTIKNEIEYDKKESKKSIGYDRHWTNIEEESPNIG